MGKNRTCVVNCVAHGYHLKVEVNGIDIGIKGGKDETKRIFADESPVTPQLPKHLKNLACIRRGENHFKVTFTRLTKRKDAKLMVELKRASQIGTDKFAVRIEDRLNETMEVTHMFWMG